MHVCVQLCFRLWGRYIWQLWEFSCDTELISSAKEQKWCKRTRKYNKRQKQEFFHLLLISIVVVKQLVLLDNYWNVPRYDEGWEISCCFGCIPWPSLSAREWEENKLSWRRESLCMEAYVYRYRLKNRFGLEAWQCDLIKTETGSEQTSNQYISKSRGWTTLPRKVPTSRENCSRIVGSSVNQHTSTWSWFDPPCG